MTYENFRAVKERHFSTSKSVYVVILLNAPLVTLRARR